MNRETFLKELGMYLKDYLPADEVESNMKYYNQYIDAQINLGRDEGNVLHDLGDPRILGKTIVDAAMAKDNAKTVDREFNEVERDIEKNRGCFWDTSTVWGKIKLICLLLAILAVIIVVLRFMFRLLYILLPVIIIVLIVGFIMNRR